DPIPVGPHVAHEADAHLSPGHRGDEVRRVVDRDRSALEAAPGILGEDLGRRAILAELRPGRVAVDLHPRARDVRRNPQAAARRALEASEAACEVVAFDGAGLTHPAGLL